MLADVHDAGSTAARARVNGVTFMKFGRAAAIRWMIFKPKDLKCPGFGLSHAAGTERPDTASRAGT